MFFGLFGRHRPKPQPSESSVEKVLEAKQLLGYVKELEANSQRLSQGARDAAEELHKHVSRNHFADKLQYAYNPTQFFKEGKK